MSCRPLLAAVACGALLFAHPARAQAPADTAGTAVDVEQQVVVSAVVHRVAAGLLDLPPGEPPTEEQRALIERVTRQVLADVDLYRAEERRIQSQRDERLDRITGIIINLAKGTAIVVALLVLRQIVITIGRGVASEEPDTPIGVFLTAPSREQAETIGRELIDDHLAARGTILAPIWTIARKDDEVRESDGVLLTLKTIRFNIGPLITHVVENTTGSVPDIITLPEVPGSDPDLGWVEQPPKRSWWTRKPAAAGAS